MVCVCVVTVTGASFVVFNGALKASSGFIAKSSIVEGKVIDFMKSRLWQNPKTNAV